MEEKVIKPYFQKDDITIYHGDCLDIMLNLEPVDLVLTDPPYGLGHKNLDWDMIDFEILFTNFLKIAYFLVKSGGRLTSFIPKKRLYSLDSLLKDYDFDVCIECKNFANYRQHLGYIDSWVPIVIIRKGKPIKTSGRNWFLVNSANTSSNISNPRNLHPAGKGVDAMSKLIILCSAVNAIILDPFLGSGTTLVAAKELNRKAIGIEIEEKYCEIAANRVEKAIRRDRMSFHLKEERKGFEL